MCSMLEQVCDICYLLFESLRLWADWFGNRGCHLFLHCSARKNWHAFLPLLSLLLEVILRASRLILILRPRLATIHVQINTIVFGWGLRSLVEFVASHHWGFFRKKLFLNVACSRASSILPTTQLDLFLNVVEVGTSFLAASTPRSAFL